MIKTLFLPFIFFIIINRDVILQIMKRTLQCSELALCATSPPVVGLVKLFLKSLITKALNKIAESLITKLL